MLTHLGETRSVLTPDHAFIAPDGHVPLALPGWQDAQVVSLISPQMGAGFSHYFVQLEANGSGQPPLAQIERFIFVLSGQLEVDSVDTSETLGPYGYAFLPANSNYTIKAIERCRLSIFERAYISLANTNAPAAIFGNEGDIEGEAFLGDDDLVVRKLLPDEHTFDIGVNTMTFQPGTPLPFVETHFMEHGLLMLEGSGIYRLNRSWYPITQGDVIWMAAYCPQWFAAVGKSAAKYLLYKENNRDPLAYTQ